MNHKISSISSTLLLEVFFSLTFTVTLFFFLTSGFPLMQAGWISSLSPKNNFAGISLFLFFSLLGFYYWRFRSSLLQFRIIRLLQSFTQQPPLRLAAQFFLAYFLLYSATGLARHAALDTRAFDLGIFAQAVWNTTQGDWLFSSIKDNINLLGDHFSPILLLTVPFYTVFSTPVTLLVLQAFAAGACLFFIALIADEKTKDRFFVFTLLVIYFFYASMRGALHEDFHPEVLAEPFWFAAFWALEKKRLKTFLASLLMAVLAKENMFGIAFILGFYALSIKKWRGPGIFVMVVSVILFLVEVKWLIPQIGNRPYLYEGFYKHLEAGPAAWLPLLGPDTWEYLMKVFLPFLFLPVLHFPTLMLTFPILAQNILSHNEAFRSFNYHYQIGLTAFLFAGTCYSYQAILERFPQIAKYKVVLISLLLFVGLVRSGPSEYTFISNSVRNINEETKLIRAQLASVPPGARVLTHNNVIPQVCHRKYVYQFEYNGTPTKLEQAEKYDADYAIFYTRYWEAGTLPYDETIAGFKSKGFQPVFEIPGFSIYKKSAA